MAWLDDRLWCHPKLTDITDAAFRAYVNGVTYSSGFATGGYLTAGQQRAIGAAAAVRVELVKAELWDDVDGQSVRVHDWDEHNGKRDARRAADRERKRAERAASQGQSAGRSQGRSAGQSRGRSDGQAADKTSDRRTLTGDGVTDEVAAAANGSVDVAAAAELEQLGLPATPLAAAWLELGRAEARTNLGGYVSAGIARGVFPSPRARASSGDKRPPAERRRAFVAGDGWRLEPDELEHQLATMGCDASELAELLDLAADLRRERDV